MAERNTVSAPVSSSASYLRASAGAVFASGFIGGGAILLVELLTVWMGASTPLGPVHIIPQVLNFEPEGGVASYPVASLFIHFMIAWGAAYLLGWVIHSRDRGRSLFIGGAGGALIYAASFLTLVLSLPQLAVASYIVMGALYVVYGIIFAAVYKQFQPTSDAA